MKAIPLRGVLLVMVRVSGPNPLYDVDWSRSTVQIRENRSIWERIEVKGLNRKGVKALRRVPWKRINWLHAPLDQYQRHLEAEGYRRLEL
jgi:hypothetical protein